MDVLPPRGTAVPLVGLPGGVGGRGADDLLRLLSPGGDGALRSGEFVFYFYFISYDIIGAFVR